MNAVNRKRVLAIIVTYNGTKWLQDCIKSLKKSSLDLDIMIIDNASTDGTAELIKDELGGIELIELNENIGFGKANNVGLSYALKENYQYAFLLNQDAQVYEKTLEELIKISKENPEFGIISPVHLDGSGNIDYSFRYYFKNYGNDKMLTDLLLKKDMQEIYEFKMINAAAWLLPLQTLKTVGGFHPMFFLYGEDDNYCQRVRFHGLKIGVAPSTYIIHDSENNNLVQPVRGSKKYYEKFLTQLKVKYGDVNTENYRRLNDLKLHYFKQSFKNLISFQTSDFVINLYKGKLISGMSFKKDIEETRKPNSTFLKQESI